MGRARTLGTCSRIERAQAFLCRLRVDRNEGLGLRASGVGDHPLFLTPLQKALYRALPRKSLPGAAI